MRRIVLPGAARKATSGGKAAGAAAGKTGELIGAAGDRASGVGMGAARAGGTTGGVTGISAAGGALRGAAIGAGIDGSTAAGASFGKLDAAEAVARLLTRATGGLTGCRVAPPPAGITGAGAGSATGMAGAAVSIGSVPFSSQAIDSSGKAARIRCTTSRLGLLRPERI
jgi:hypothetical protein